MAPDSADWGNNQEITTPIHCEQNNHTRTQAWITSGLRCAPIYITWIYLLTRWRATTDVISRNTVSATVQTYRGFHNNNKQIIRSLHNQICYGYSFCNQTRQVRAQRVLGCFNHSVETQLCRQGLGWEGGLDSSFLLTTPTHWCLSFRVIGTASVMLLPVLSATIVQFSDVRRISWKNAHLHEMCFLW